MDRDTARDLFHACEKVLSALGEAEVAIERVEAAERSLLMHLLGSAIGEALQLRSPAVLQYPDLEAPRAMGEPDTDLDAHESDIVARLPQEEARVIDAALLAECAAAPRKVARVVSAAMRNLGDAYEHVPLGYYVQRVAALAAAGRLVADGNLDYMRFSEVRLA